MKTLIAMGLVRSVVACGAADADDPAAEAEEELRTRGMTRIDVNRGIGFRPPPPDGSCHPSGKWTVDFESEKLTGNACIGGQQTEIDRGLTSAELSKVRARVSALRTTGRPPACPTDIPVNSVTVHKGDDSTRYVDQRAACGYGNAVKEAGLAKLVEVLEDLSAVDVVPADPCALARCTANTECVVDNGSASCVPWMPSP
jgi:hypothetical protein